MCAQYPTTDRHDEVVDSERDEPPAATAGSPGAQPPFWRSWAVGERVIVRYRLDAAGAPAAGTATPDHAAAGPTVTDALGELLAVGDAGVTVRTRRGDVAVPGAAITLGKRVPPAPARRTGRAAGREGAQ
jgi:hypothetical protein